MKNMRKIICYSILLVTCLAFGQSDMNLLLKKYNTGSVPYISVQELKMNKGIYLILDTRRKEEYDVSHIPNAIWVSEKVKDTVDALSALDKDQPIVVYCSVGIRSEDFGEKLQKQGYTNVKNLYGSVFAWKDAGYQVVNAKGKITDSVHVFSKVWGKYLQTGVKVYQ